MKYLKSFGIYLIVILIFSLISSILYYFDIISSNVNTTFKIITFILSYIISGFYISKRSYKKEGIEGIKLFFITFLFNILLTLILPSIKLNIKSILLNLLGLLFIFIGIKIQNKKYKKN